MIASVSAAGTPGLIGVLGGMGPLATIDFMHKVLSATPASVDQDHVPVIVSSIPQVPDRTAAYRGEGASPLAAMVASGERLARAGAALIVIPCNTAHLWFDKIQMALDLPMLHLVDAALEDAVDSVGAFGNIGLLCTEATLTSGLYVNRPRNGGVETRVQWTLPTAGEMIELVTPGIDAVKAGNLNRGREYLEAAAQALLKRGAHALILGCTEVPLVLARSNVSVPVIDATASLARRAVAWSLAQRASQGVGPAVRGHPA